MNSNLRPAWIEQTGPLYRVQGSVRAQVSAAVGELVRIRLRDGRLVPSEVIGFENDRAQLMPLEASCRFQEGDLVIASGRPMEIPVGHCLLGRVLDATGRPLDAGGVLKTSLTASLQLQPPNPLQRRDITDPFETGIRVVDGLLTIGRGQRVGIFAGSGVGKSTLLGNIARNAEAEINVVALIGERGREVKPFIEESLGAEGLKKSVVIVSTSDESPLCRVRAVETAIAIAHWFRDQQHNVLLLMDSLTRFAAAQKELGLLLGEPPTTRGFPPSVSQRMASMMEQLGNSDRGSITALITVLVDGDDMNEPVADTARSILDGHIVLKREIAEMNHYPAIDVLASVSRLARKLADPQHNENASTVRQCLALYREIQDLVQIGAYKKGSVRATDGAIECLPFINAFLQQGSDKTVLSETLQRLAELGTICHAKMGWTLA